MNTKKNFIRMAEIIRALECAYSEKERYPMMVIFIMDMFKDENPNFDEERFIKAIGFNPKVRLEEVQNDARWL